MRICRVSQTYPTGSNNGKGLHCYYVSKLMKYPTLILTKDYPGEEYWPSDTNVTVKRISYYSYPFPKDNRLSMEFVLALITYFTGQVTFLFKSIPSLFQFQPELVHLQSPHGILIGIFSAIVFRSKVVLTFHGSDLRRINRIPFYFYLLKSCDRIFYVDEGMKDSLLRHFSAEKLVSTPSGIDLEIFQKQNLIRKKYFITVGNLRWQKAQNILVEAFAMLSPKAPEFELYLVGEGELKGELEKLSSELGVATKVKFLGRKSNIEVANLLSESYCFILTSTTEGMPKALLEAMATGTPSIVTDVGACKEVLSNAGWVVEKDRVQAVATALDEAVFNERIYVEKLENAKLRGTEFSWDKLTATLKSNFEELFSER